MSAPQQNLWVEPGESMQPGGGLPMKSFLQSISTGGRPFETLHCGELTRSSAMGGG
jgi:hypothetical protein